MPLKQIQDFATCEPLGESSQANSDTKAPAMHRCIFAPPEKPVLRRDCNHWSTRFWNDPWVNALGWLDLKCLLGDWQLGRVKNYNVASSVHVTVQPLQDSFKFQQYPVSPSCRFKPPSTGVLEGWYCSQVGFTSDKFHGLAMIPEWFLSLEPPRLCSAHTTVDSSMTKTMPSADLRGNLVDQPTPIALWTILLILFHDEVLEGLLRSIPGLQSCSSLPLQSPTESFLAKTGQHGALFGWYLIWSTLLARRHSWALSFLKAEVQLFNRCSMAAVFCCS